MKTCTHNQPFVDKFGQPWFRHARDNVPRSHRGHRMSSAGMVCGTCGKSYPGDMMMVWSRVVLVLHPVYRVKLLFPKCTLTWCHRSHALNRKRLGLMQCQQNTWTLYQQHTAIKAGLNYLLKAPTLWPLVMTNVKCQTGLVGLTDDEDIKNAWNCCGNNAGYKEFQACWHPFIFIIIEYLKLSPSCILLLGAVE